MEIAALPVPTAFTGITPESRSTAHDAPRGQRAAALVKSGAGGGLPDEVILQGEVLRKDNYTYSKPKKPQGSELQGEAQKERNNSSYSTPRKPVDSYTQRIALNAYQEGMNTDIRNSGASLHHIDVYV